ncbi:hypothetical protein BP5796_12798 [Coleophoma crateriformis]|uniref:Uncharacterized protein n=1 Tax=Coleophoma crateriformis TaxID=565419 RepID=A0A3D8Q6S6_9HELO|nr:hypothetical protein BP5796_12798 [Coleophoma crateriformis]
MSRFKPRTYTIAFCSSGLISLILQGVGGAIDSTANTQEEVDTGTDIMIAGLVFQVMSLAAFVVLSADFALRLRQNQGLWNTENAAVYRSFRFKAFLCALGIATLAVITRSIFRAIELSDGFSGELANDEVLYMILEPPMISIAVIALTLCHPGDFSDAGTSNTLKAGREDGTELEPFSGNV